MVSGLLGKSHVRRIDTMAAGLFFMFSCKNSNLCRACQASKGLTKELSSLSPGKGGLYILQPVGGRLRSLCSYSVFTWADLGSTLFLSHAQR